MTYDRINGLRGPFMFVIIGPARHLAICMLTKYFVTGH